MLGKEDSSLSALSKESAENVFLERAEMLFSFMDSGISQER